MRWRVMRKSRVEILRANRGLPPVGVAARVVVAEEFKTVVKQRRNLGKAGEAWAGVVPERLRAAATLGALRRGTLNVHVPDAAARFELDRWLRSGGEAALKKAAPMLKRLRLEA